MKQKKSIFDPVRQWWRKHQIEKAKRVLRHMISNKDPEIYGQIREIADLMAKRMCMGWLDDKRIQHCARCSTTGPLVKVSGIFFCVAHAGQVAKEGREKAAAFQEAQ